jgi:uncharacterized protein YkwD
MRFIDHIKNHFLPHRGNNHKANALKTPLLFFYLLLFVFVQLTSPFMLKFKGDVLGYAVNIEEQKLLEYTNDERMNAGLKPVKMNSALSSAALEKAKYMFAHNFWAHNAPDGTTPWKFITDAKYDYLFAGENLAKDFEDSKGVVDAWMNSPSHRANILQEKYQDIGFAVLNGNLNGEDTTLVVQMFGTPVVASAPSFPEVSGVNEAKNVVPVQEINPAVSGASIKNFVFTKEFSLYFIGFLIALLAIDGFFIWRKKIIRVSSHNLAHLMLLMCLFVVISFLKSGKII